MPLLYLPLCVDVRDLATECHENDVTFGYSRNRNRSKNGDYGRQSVAIFRSAVDRLG